MNLIIQGLNVPTLALNDLVKLTHATRVEPIPSLIYPLMHPAFRLHNAQQNEQLAAYCHSASLDFGYVPEHRKLTDIGLFVTDMDSTLITIECIDEIADMQGLKPQVAAITEAAMQGKIDFAQSLRQRVALLAGLEVTALERVIEERLQLSPGAELLLKTLYDNGIKTMLVSGGFTYFTERLKAQLGIDYAFANELGISNGKLTGKILGDMLDGAAKRRHLIEVREQLNLSPQSILAVGDGANDLPMLNEAGISVAYHAKPVVRQQATYALNFVGLDGMINLLE